MRNQAQEKREALRDHWCSDINGVQSEI